MRELIYEQAYEKPIMAGEYEYRQDGVPTGAVEFWQLTSAADGYQFLRVDLDGRRSSGHSYLYHAVINQTGGIERLKYRFWSASLRVVGDVVVDDRAVTATRKINNQTIEQVFDLSHDFCFWFPSVAGLYFANESPTAVTLNGKIGGEETLAVQVVDFDYQPVTDNAWKLSWGDQWRIVQRNAENGWPMGMERVGLNGDGVLTAVEARHTQYKQRG